MKGSPTMWTCGRCSIKRTGLKRVMDDRNLFLPIVIQCATRSASEAAFLFQQDICRRQHQRSRFRGGRRTCQHGVRSVYTNCWSENVVPRVLRPLQAAFSGGCLETAEAPAELARRSRNWLEQGTGGVSGGHWGQGFGCAPCPHNRLRSGASHGLSLPPICSALPHPLPLASTFEHHHHLRSRFFPPPPPPLSPLPSPSALSAFLFLVTLVFTALFLFLRQPAPCVGPVLCFRTRADDSKSQGRAPLRPAGTAGDTRYRALPTKTTT